MRGVSLFEFFMGNDDDILKQTAESFGRLPDTWWNSFEERALWVRGGVWAAKERGGTTTHWGASGCLQNLNSSEVARDRRAMRPAI